MSFPFIQIALGPHDSYKEPYDPAGFVGNKELFDQYLEDHATENHTGVSGDSNTRFPFCCEFHKFIFEDVQNWYTNFPNESEQDKEFAEHPKVDKSNYEGMPDKIARAILYTQYHIEKTINSEDWYDDNTEYFDYVVSSFGYPPVGYGYYLHYLKHLLQNLEGSDSEKNAHKKLLDYIEDQYYTPIEKGEFPDLKSLWAIYEKWLEVFPFNVSYFVALKNVCEKTFFVFLFKEKKTNRYTNWFSAKSRTQAELLEVLTLTTSDLLSKIDSVELLEKGQITDVKSLALELKKSELRIKTDLLFGRFSTGEIEYANTLKEWLAYQKDFFRDIALFITDKPEPENEKQNPEREKIKYLQTEFEKLGFSNLPMVKGKLSENNIERLFGLLSINKTPYQIAMLGYLGFLDLMFESHSKEQTYKTVAKIIKANDRVVKGNCLVLSNQSSENRTIYTAHLHKKDVEKDYQKIKLG